MGEAKSTGERTLAELAQESGVPARTIRFYISRGLVDGPVKAGRGAVYTSDHLDRLEKIKDLQAEGRMLSEIVHVLDPAGGDAERNAAVPEPSEWWHYEIQPDVMVSVRADVSPWRMKQIRAAVDSLAESLAEPGGPARNRAIDKSNASINKQPRRILK